MLNSSPPVLIRVYADSQQAHLARSMLQQHGIDSVITGDQVGTTLSWYGTAVVKVNLMVQQADAEAAHELLEELEQDLRAETSPGDFEQADLDWVCPNCEEQSPTSFAACWSCGTQKPAHPELVPAEKRPTHTVDTPQVVPESKTSDVEQSPYDAPAVQQYKVNLTNQHDLVTRATRAAVFSIFFPPLGLYSLYLIYRCFTEGQPPRRVYLALVASLITGCASTLMILAVLLS